MSAWKVEIRSGRGGHRVALVVGAQSFTLVGVVDAGGAEWMAAQLRHAIQAIERGVLNEALDAGIAAGRESDTNGEAYSATLAKILLLHNARLPSCSGCEPGSEGMLTDAEHAHRNAMVALGLDAGKTDCSGCTDPRSEGTHQMGTRQHP